MKSFLSAIFLHYTSKNKHGVLKSVTRIWRKVGARALARIRRRSEPEPELSYQIFLIFCFNTHFKHSFQKTIYEKGAK